MTRAFSLTETAPDADAEFARRVREHQAMVYSIAWHCLRDRAAAEETAQDVFLELHRRREELEADGHLKNWLRKVTMNRCIDQARRRKLRPRIGIEDIPEPSVTAEPGDPLLRDALQRLVAALPQKWRMVVVLRYQEDMEPAEIAELIGAPLGTVKSQLHRALSVLREKMTRRMGETV
jgi:RNA polymerase sigma-70 factor (ECF subfamily)